MKLGRLKVATIALDMLFDSKRGPSAPHLFDMDRKQRADRIEFLRTRYEQ